MVPNITSDGSFYEVIAYNKKVDDGTAKVLWYQKIATDTFGNVDWTLCTGFWTLHRTEHTRPETGCSHLIESFPERHSFRRTDDRIGTGVHCGNQPYIVWLHEEIDYNLGSYTSVDCRKEPFIRKGQKHV